MSLWTIYHIKKRMTVIYTGLFISPSGISELDCATTKTDTAERSISIGRESLQVSVLPAIAGSRELLTSEGSWQTFLAHARQSQPMGPEASSFRSAQVATLLEFHVPLTNCFVRRWFCAVHDPKPALHRHNWLSFGKFQDTERFLIHCERHFSSRLPPSGGTCKYAKAHSTKKKNLERFSTYWYAPFCRVCLGCCAVEFGNPGGTYE